MKIGEAGSAGLIFRLFFHFNFLKKGEPICQIFSTATPCTSLRTVKSYSLPDRGSAEPYPEIPEYGIFAFLNFLMNTNYIARYKINSLNHTWIILKMSVIYKQNSVISPSYCPEIALAIVRISYFCLAQA